MKAILCHKVGPLVSFCVLVFSASEKLVGQQRGLEPSDYYDMVSVGDVEISPDGDLVAFTVTRILEDENTRRREVWMQVLTGCRTEGKAYQYVDDTSLEIIRSDLQSNASYSDTLTGKRWYWQSATDWVPRMSETGILPHGEAYIGKTLKQGNTGTISEGGIEFNWEVDNGGKIDSKQTALLQVYTSYISESLLGYQYQYQYSFDMYFSEGSSFPVKFEMNFNSEARSPGGKLYAISIDYRPNSNGLSEGYTEVPSTSYKTNSNTKTGEFKKWNNGAPAFGNGSCGLDSNITIQDGIQKGKEDILKFNNYIEDQEGKGKPAFVTEANYTKINGSDDTWNFTMSYRNPQSDSIKGWELNYNRTNISGENVTLNNPIMSMEDIEEPLTMCSAEIVMTDFDEISRSRTNRIGGI